MAQNGFRHKYQVAEYFGVTPQAISSWLTKGVIPSKHFLRVQSEIEIGNYPEPQEPSSESSKTVIDYLINENVKLKRELAQLKFDLSKSKNDSDNDFLSEGNNTGTSTFTTSPTGGDQAHNNLQPYITAYMWRRTA